MTSDRKRRKKNSLRGQRTMGGGSSKNRRGAGCRGGRGNAGSNKHRFHSLRRLAAIKYKLKAEKKGKAITLFDLDRALEALAAKGKVKKEGNAFVVDKKCGYEKILSQGETTKKIILKINASKGAISKIIKAGGKFEYAKKNYEKDVDAELKAAEGEEDIEFEEAETDEEAELPKK